MGFLCNFIHGSLYFDKEIAGNRDITKISCI